MQELRDDINRENRINFSLNKPVALILGSAGFLGSHLCEKLLSLNLQVVGIDNLSSGAYNNLVSFINLPNFYFLEEDIANISNSSLLLSLPRIDYVFIAVDPLVSKSYIESLDSFFGFLKNFNDLNYKGPNHHVSSNKISTKILLLSSTLLYDNQLLKQLKPLAGFEKIFASYTKKYHLNARVLRIAEVYGPRMHFRNNDSFTRLIKAAISNKLFEESTILDFSSRAVYISDIIALILKVALSGNTTNKIFDGARVYPLSIAEIKQLLLNKSDEGITNIKFTQLPAWPTPNLLKTVHELSWTPKYPVIDSLIDTLNFFQNHPVNQNKIHPQSSQVPKISGWSFKELDQKIATEGDGKITSPNSHDIPAANNKLINLKGAIFFIIVFLILFFGLVLPIGVLGTAYFIIPKNIKEFNTTLNESHSIEDNRFSASTSLLMAKISQQILSPIFLFAKVLSFPIPTFLLNIAVDSSHLLILEKTAFVHNQLDKCSTTIFSNNPLLNSSCNQENLLDTHFYSLQQIGDTQLSSIIEQIRGLKIFSNYISAAPKNILILVHDNRSLQFDGGRISSAAIATFDKGRLSSLDYQSSSRLVPLLQKAFGNPDFNNQTALNQIKEGSDFTTFAPSIILSANKIVGKNIDGVISLDLIALQTLAKLNGGEEKGSAFNLDKQVVNSETVNSMSVSDRDNSINSSFQKILQNISHQGLPLRDFSSLSNLISEKHLEIYISDPKVESLILSLDGGGAMTAIDQTDNGLTSDYLSIYEQDASGSAATSKASYDLATSITNTSITHILKASLGSSVSKKFFFIFIPLGSTITSASVNGLPVNISSTVFSNKNGSLILVPANDQSNFQIDYYLPSSLQFLGNNSKYNFIWQKQFGKDTDKLHFSLSLSTGHLGDSTTSASITKTMRTDTVFPFQIFR